ncbi:MAG: TrbC/VirB2 family protein [Luteimonas sp.]
MKSYKDAAPGVEARRTFSSLFMAVMFVSVLAVPGALMAQEFGGADGRVNTFFQNINGLLNIASISVVTIAVIFAGYQIAFAHKRMADVAPVLIGGFLIGAAGQLARMLLGPDGGTPTTMLLDILPKLYA